MEFHFQFIDKRTDHQLQALNFESQSSTEIITIINLLREGQLRSKPDKIEVES